MEYAHATIKIVRATVPVGGHKTFAFYTKTRQLCESIKNNQYELNSFRVSGI